VGGIIALGPVCFWTVQAYLIAVLGNLEQSDYSLHLHIAGRYVEHMSLFLENVTSICGKIQTRDLVFQA
jgi:hypothetical protein